MQPSQHPTTGFNIRSRQYLRLIEPLIPGVAVDIGGGQGYWAMQLAQRGWQVNIVEKSETARNDAFYLTQTLSNKIQLFSTINSLKQNSTDLICALEVLEHISEPSKALSHWSTYLKLDGYGLFSFPAWQEWFSVEDTRAGHLIRFNKEQILNLFSVSNGWKICRMSGYGFPFRNLLQLYNNFRLKKKHFAEPYEQTLSSGIYKEARLPVWLDLFVTNITDFFQRLIGPQKPNWGLIILAQKSK